MDAPVGAQEVRVSRSERELAGARARQLLGLRRAGHELEEAPGPRCIRPVACATRGAAQSTSSSTEKFWSAPSR